MTVVRMGWRRGLSVSLAMAALVSVLACGSRYGAPKAQGHDARFGFFGGHATELDLQRSCRDWRGAVNHDGYAGSHTSYPESDTRASCFTQVVHVGDRAIVGRVPEGCGVPTNSERDAMADVAERLVGQQAEPALFPCGLTSAQEAAARRHNARALRAAAAEGGSYPYTAVVVPGYGEAGQGQSALATWLPDDACLRLSALDVDRYGAMMVRTRRAAAALEGGVAPLAIVTGGSPHSSMVEAFAMLHLLQCGRGVAGDRILVEPCAEHTHTNLRNAARWLVSLHARTAYIVTDDALQAGYFQDWGLWNLIGGSVDQRSLRDWGYLLGAFRQASVGIEGGFWYTPYRFWAEPVTGLGSFTCVMQPAP